jgi:hypothetical protein
MEGSEHSDELLEGELIIEASAQRRRDALAERASQLVPVAKTAAVATVGAAAGAVTAVVVAKAATNSSRRTLRSGRRNSKADTIESTATYLIEIHRLASR